MIESDQKPLLILAGPTASGKSGLALAAADHFDGVVINSDSMQVYAELRIITARPSAEDEAHAPHELYGVMPAAERCSAGRWRELAVGAIEEAWAESKLPILVGGTGLYIKALLEGLSEIPEVPDGLRQEVIALHEALGPEAFHARVAEVDPEAAARLPSGDRQRLIRAYEVFLATGTPLTQWHQTAPATPDLAADTYTILLDPPRDELYARCDARLEQMLAKGALEEVGALMALSLDPSLPAMKALGVPEFIAHLNGEKELEPALAAAQQSTRNFAKRQNTWFRNQFGKPNAVFAQYSERKLEEIFADIRF
jgi:tRNA dimethylallyltransferase